jgi:hypothetical protein
MKSPRFYIAIPPPNPSKLKKVPSKQGVEKSYQASPKVGVLIGQLPGIAIERAI